MATAQEYINQIAKYIGISGTDNIFNTWYWGMHVYDPDTYPWCATCQSYVGVHDLKMPFKASASAAGVANQGTRIPDNMATKGDWVLFNWDGRQSWDWADHIGVVEWFDHSSGYFGTIEGNTGGGEGTVARCTRYNYGSYATAFFRPPYSGSAPDPTPAPTKKAKFRVKENGKWQKEGYAGTPGVAKQGIAIDMPGWYQVCTQAHGWLERVSGYDINDEEHGFAGWQDSPITAVRCYYETPNPSVTGYYYAKYRVSEINQEYYPWQIDDEVSDTMDGYAGDFVPINRFELVIE